MAIVKFMESLQLDRELRKHLLRHSGTPLVCHRLPTQARHADCSTSESKAMFPQAYDRENHDGIVPSSALLNRSAQLRLDDPDLEEGSSPDEGALPAGLGWIGSGSYTCRDVRDGQALASPERWVVENHHYPEGVLWTDVSDLYMALSRHVGTLALLSSQESRKISASPV